MKTSGAKSTANLNELARDLAVATYKEAAHLPPRERAFIGAEIKTYGRDLCRMIARATAEHAGGDAATLRNAGRLLAELSYRVLLIQSLKWLPEIRHQDLAERVRKLQDTLKVAQAMSAANRGRTPIPTRSVPKAIADEAIDVLSPRPPAPNAATTERGPRAGSDPAQGPDTELQTTFPSTRRDSQRRIEQAAPVALAPRPTAELLPRIQGDKPRILRGRAVGSRTRDPGFTTQPQGSMSGHSANKRPLGADTPKARRAKSKHGIPTVRVPHSDRHERATCIDLSFDELETLCFEGG